MNAVESEEQLGLDQEDQPETREEEEEPETEIQTTEIQDDGILVEQVNQLYLQIDKPSLPTALEIGQLLAKKKATLEHGHWRPWVDAHFRPEMARTLRRWVTLHKKRDKLVNVTTLSEAYQVTASTWTPRKAKPESKEMADLREDIQAEWKQHLEQLFGGYSRHKLKVAYQEGIRALRKKLDKVR